MSKPKPLPNQQDRANYNYPIKTSPFFSKPETFLKVGDRVRARFRVWDLPCNEPSWGWVSAEAGETGTCVFTEPGYWPTVTFDRTGCSTCVTDFEVEVIPALPELTALSSFFEGLAEVLNSTESGDAEARKAGADVAHAFLKDVCSGNLPGISLSELVADALLKLRY